jgi:L-asparaginase
MRRGTGEIWMKERRLLILTTGGTFDKQYFDALSEYKIGETIVEAILERAKVTHAYRIVELLKKDSLEITEGDRQSIASFVREADEQRVVIVHGTDTMTKTAAVVTDIGKVIVFTGALSPARFLESDATFNLGMAVAAAQCLEKGAYIAMNGTVYRADKIRNDRVLGQFILKDDGQ